MFILFIVIRHFVWLKAYFCVISMYVIMIRPYIIIITENMSHHCRVVQKYSEQNKNAAFVFKTVRFNGCIRPIGLTVFLNVPVLRLQKGGTEVHVYPRTL